MLLGHRILPTTQEMQGNLWYLLHDEILIKVIPLYPIGQSRLSDAKEFSKRDIGLESLVIFYCLKYVLYVSQNRVR